ncbi:unnamed protein product [Cyclocybe aegerita]|uniref:F-box domain-containing protein n=1 Tax=Cyclocybe aegerita TaxID=1973307 RepID=A0A8S0WZH5_CYCAE|nr:unnamed protein product [Cyclocybe aegerita]
MAAQDLPADVLLNIFHLCLEDPGPIPDDPLRSSRSLSQVCTSWRRIFFSDLRWIAIGHASTTALGDGREYRMTITHLVQGANRPVNPLDIPLPWSYIASLDLHGLPIHPRVALRLFQNSYTTLAEAYLQIHVQTTSTPTTASTLAQPFPMLQTTLRRLTKVHLIIIDDARGSDELKDFFTIAHLPKLKHLRVEAVGGLSLWRRHLLSSILPWCSRHVEQLDLIQVPPVPAVGRLGADVGPQPTTTRHLTYQDVEDLFQSIPNVRFLRLPRCILLHSTTLRKLENGILLPFLQVLEVGTSSAENGDDILSMVARRNLEAGCRAGLPPMVGPSNAVIQAGFQAGEHANDGPLYPIFSVDLSIPEADAEFFSRDCLSQHLGGLEGVEVEIGAWV